MPADESPSTSGSTGIRFRETAASETGGARFRRDSIESEVEVEGDTGDSGHSGSRFRFTVVEPEPFVPAQSDAGRVADFPGQALEGAPTEPALVEPTVTNVAPTEPAPTPVESAPTPAPFEPRLDSVQSVTSPIQPAPVSGEPTTADLPPLPSTFDSSPRIDRTWPDVDRRNGDRRSGDERRQSDRRAQLSHEPELPQAFEPTSPVQPDAGDSGDTPERADAIGYGPVSNDPDPNVAPIEDHATVRAPADESDHGFELPEGGWPLPRSNEGRPAWLDHDPFVRNEDLPWADDDADTPGFSSSEPFAQSEARTEFDPTDITPLSVEPLRIEPLEVGSHVDIEPGPTAEVVDDFDALFPPLDSGSSAARFEIPDDTFSMPAFSTASRNEDDDAGDADDAWREWAFAADEDVHDDGDAERYDDTEAPEYRTSASTDWSSSFADLQDIDSTFSPHRADPWGDDERTASSSHPLAGDDWLADGGLPYDDDSSYSAPSDETDASDAAGPMFDELPYASADSGMPPKGARSLTGMNDATDPWWLQDVGMEPIGDAGAASGIDVPAHHVGGQRGQAERDTYADADFDDEDQYGDYDSKRRRQPSDFFDEDADLDEPDEYEVGDDDWAFADEDDDMRDARRQQREPRDSRSRRPAPRSPRSRPAPQSNFQMPSIFNDRSKLTVIVAVVLVIIVLSTVGKDLFAKVAAATDPNAVSDGDTCATVDVRNDDRDVRSGVQAIAVAPPSGWTVVPDHEAMTGAVDFSRALRNEPDVGSALAILDSSRFQRGYDRAFDGPGKLEATVAVYQFADAICAAHYVAAHDSDSSVVSTFDVPDIEGARGVVRKQSDGSLAYIVRVARGEHAVIVTWRGDPSPARAVVGAIDLARGQWSAMQ